MGVDAKWEMIEDPKKTHKIFCEDLDCRGFMWVLRNLVYPRASVMLTKKEYDAAPEYIKSLSIKL